MDKELEVLLLFYGGKYFSECKVNGMEGGSKNHEVPTSVVEAHTLFRVT